MPYAKEEFAKARDLQKRFRRGFHSRGGEGFAGTDGRIRRMEIDRLKRRARIAGLVGLLGEGADIGLSRAWRPEVAQRIASQSAGRNVLEGLLRPGVYGTAGLAEAGRRLFG